MVIRSFLGSPILLKDCVHVGCPFLVGHELREFPLELAEEEFVSLVGQFVLVRSFVECALLDVSFVNERVEVGIQSPVVDLLAVVGFEGAFDR